MIHIDFKGNNYIETVFNTIDGLSIFSEKFNTKIQNIGLWILQSGHESSKEKEITQEIKNLYSLMLALKIFSTAFASEIYINLHHGLLFELKKPKK